MTVENRQIDISLDVPVRVIKIGERYLFECDKYNFEFVSQDTSGWAFVYFDNALKEHIKKSIEKKLCKPEL